MVARGRELDFRGWHTTRWGAPANIRYPKITVTSPGFLQFPKVKFKLYVTFFSSWWRSWVFFQSKRSVHLKCNTICINDTDIYTQLPLDKTVTGHFAPKSFRPHVISPRSLSPLFYRGEMTGYQINTSAIPVYPKQTGLHCYYPFQHQTHHSPL